MLRRILFLVLGFSVLGMMFWLPTFDRTEDSQSQLLPLEQTKTSEPPAIPRSGPEWQREFFKRWHYPHGAVMDQTVHQSLLEDVAKLPVVDRKREKTVGPWVQVGPAGMVTPEGARYSGRVLDLDAVSGQGTTIASASGGLWRYNLFTPVPLTDDITSQWTSTVAYHPTNPQTILVGTGEFWIHAGTGIWKSTNSGESWYQTNTSTVPNTVFRIRYSDNGAIVHAATEDGYYRSLDGGENWVRLRQGVFTDLAIRKLDNGTEVLYATLWNEGLFYSENQGGNWYRVNHQFLPTTTMKRGAVAVAPSNPNVIFVAMSQLVENGDDDYYGLLGIYKSIDGGVNWLNVTPADNYMGAQAWYNNVISVCPTNEYLVYAGGVTLVRSTNGGASWEYVNDPHLHVDYHAMQWHENGQYFWIGHDGGWSFSNNQGEPGSWASGSNYLPITQFTEIDAGGVMLGMAAYCGGSQDNSICLSTDGGSSWDYLLGGDGGGVEFGTAGSDIWIRLGVFSDGMDFHSLRSQDGGASFLENNEGLAASGTWYPAVRRSGDGVMYTHSGNSIYSRESGGSTWVEETTAGGMPYYVREFTVSPVVGHEVIFACLDSYGSYKLVAKQGGQWFYRSTGLPSGAQVRKVVPHPNDVATCYALMDGMSSPGEKIFKSVEHGQNWVNITGNLPNVPLGDLVVHPDTDDIMYVGTGGFGFFQTHDGGLHWEAWNTGIPSAVVVTEMKTVDMRHFLNGGFHIMAGTYGRSIWRRDIKNDSVSAVEGAVPQSGIIAEHMAAPNPFNATTTIQFELAKATRVTVDVYDVAGRRVLGLLAEERPEGSQQVTWDGKDRAGSVMASGKYLVLISAGGQSVTQSVILAK